MAKKHHLLADDNWFDVLLYNAMKIFWKMRRDFEECFKYFCPCNKSQLRPERHWTPLTFIFIFQNMFYCFPNMKESHTGYLVNCPFKCPKAFLWSLNSNNTYVLKSLSSFSSLVTPSLSACQDLKLSTETCRIYSLYHSLHHYKYHTFLHCKKEVWGYMSLFEKCNAVSVY